MVVCMNGGSIHLHCTLPQPHFLSSLVFQQPPDRNWSECPHPSSIPLHRYVSEHSLITASNNNRHHSDVLSFVNEDQGYMTIRPKTTCQSLQYPEDAPSKPRPFHYPHGGETETPIPSPRHPPNFTSHLPPSPTPALSAQPKFPAQQPNMDRCRQRQK